MVVKSYEDITVLIQPLLNSLLQVILEFCERSHH